MKTYLYYGWLMLVCGFVLPACIHVHPGHSAFAEEVDNPRIGHEEEVRFENSVEQLVERLAALQAEIAAVERALEELNQLRHPDRPDPGAQRGRRMNPQSPRRRGRMSDSSKMQGRGQMMMGRTEMPGHGEMMMGRTEMPGHGEMMMGRTEMPGHGEMIEMMMGRTGMPGHGEMMMGRTEMPGRGQMMMGRTEMPGHGEMMMGRTEMPGHGEMMMGRTGMPGRGEMMMGRTGMSGHGQRKMGRTGMPGRGQRMMGRMGMPGRGQMMSFQPLNRVSGVAFEDFKMGFVGCPMNGCPMNGSPMNGGCGVGNTDGCGGDQCRDGDRDRGGDHSGHEEFDFDVHGGKGRVMRFEGGEHGSSAEIDVLGFEGGEHGGQIGDRVFRGRGERHSDESGEREGDEHSSIKLEFQVDGDMPIDLQRVLKQLEAQVGDLHDGKAEIVSHTIISEDGGNDAHVFEWSGDLGDLGGSIEHLIIEKLGALDLPQQEKASNQKSAAKKSQHKNNKKKNNKNKNKKKNNNKNKNKNNNKMKNPEQGKNSSDDRRILGLEDVEVLTLNGKVVL